MHLYTPAIISIHLRIGNRTLIGKAQPAREICFYLYSLAGWQVFLAPMYGFPQAQNVNIGQRLSDELSAPLHFLHLLSRPHRNRGNA
jgi:hypothetical protein